MYQAPTIQFRLVFASQSGDQGEASLFDLTVNSESVLNPLFPTGGTVYDAWCLDKVARIDVPGSYTGAIYSSYEIEAIRANIPSLAGSAYLDNLDNINWLINWYDGSNPGISWGEVQAAIWKLLGQDWTSEASYLGAVDQADVDRLASDALANDGYLPEAGGRLGVLVDASASGPAGQQPLLIETRAAALGDRVFHDLDADGVQDAGEQGIAGARVDLVRDLDGDGRYDSAGEVVATTATDADGAYLFKGLAPGIPYQVQFTLPAGFDAVSPRQADGDPAGAGNSDGLLADPVVLSPGQTLGTIDAGFYRYASLGDRVWDDADRNGLQDAGEAGVANVTVRLLDAQGNLLLTQLTDADGGYRFLGLQPGVYQLEFVRPDGYAFTTADAGDDAADSDAAAADGRSGLVELGSGEDERSLDAGLVREAPPAQARIGNRVWEDANANGVQDDGEQGIWGATVLLKDLAGNVLQTTVTDAQGLYGFDVAAGSYTLQVVVPAESGYVASPQDAGGDDARDTDIDAGGNTGVVTVAAGEVNDTVDMGGYRRASLGDRVWLDANANGQQDDGEAGVAGVVVNLLDAAGNLVASQATDGSGNYLFGGLTPGQYRVEVVRPDGYAFTTADAGGDATDSDVATADGRSGLVELSSAEDDRSIDAGLVREAPPALAHIGNRVWEDANANGVQDDGEQGIWGATILLKDLAGNVLQTTVTDEQGLYGFDVAAGSYTLQVVVPAESGYVASPQDAGGDDARDTDIDAGGNTGVVTVAAGEVNDTVDMGGWRRASLGDRVWLDANANGQQDDGEAGVAGVVVNLLDAAGNLVASQATDGSGNYLFGGLTPGQYRVEVVRPDGYAFTTADAGGDATDSDVATTDGRSGLVELSSAEDERSLDAGLVRQAPRLGSIGDRVFEDLDFDGVQDGGERGLDGITVRLLDGSGNTVRTTTTAAGGQYLFDQLAAGDYQVQVDRPTGWHVTKADQGGDDALDSDIDAATGRSATIRLAEGQADTSVDAGLYRKAAIGDRVWSDADHDGVQDPTEGGIAGIRVALLDAGDGRTLATTTTDGTGHYQFGDLDPGRYVLEFDKQDVVYTPSPDASYALNGWSWAIRDAGTDDGADSDVGPAVTNTPTARTDVVTLQSGEVNDTVDAGITPIVIDLDGDGVETIARGAATGAGFDLFGTGRPVVSGWVGADDGLLAVDRDGNGRIEGIDELFGGTAAGDGFARLAGFDSNGDGRVDAADARFDELRVWRDADGDQVTDAGELMTLAEAGIASLGTGFNATLPALDAAGNLHGERGSAIRADGQSVEMTDVYFAVSAEDAAAAGVALPSLSQLLGDDRALDGLLGGSATPTVALAPTAAPDVDTGDAALAGQGADWLRLAAALSRDEPHLVAA